MAGNAPAPNHHAGISPAALNSVRSFSGRLEEDAYEWLHHMDRTGALFQWSDEQKCAVALLKTARAAGAWARTLPLLVGWVAFRSALMERFGDNFESLLAQLDNCSQNRREPIRGFNDRFRSLITRIEQQAHGPNNGAPNIENPMYRTRYLRAIRPGLRNQVATQRPTRLEQAMQAAIYFEDGQSDSVRENPMEAAQNFTAAATAASGASSARGPEQHAAGNVATAKQWVLGMSF